ncbi:Prolyl tripeptidyl peptidase precursor [Enhygromyxa salina]|uniref:Prolyl tripeptidyl peptidase n=1 Tax=Enhygromyxa salina TaxID=215803 RepID=A0A2S9XKA0_9BACT|nr:prolyl oligopeptidase family serine peptidase [Enhygromyxa salina]PRP93283.1 Prolyl tripeptidyl peptidase precursor [Enhygromyxa salina]
MPSVARTLTGSLALALVAPLLACTPPKQARPYPTAEPAEGELGEQLEPPSPTVVSFLDRELDLAPFLEGFPYSRFEPTLEHGRMFYMETGDRYVLRSVPLPGASASEIAPLELDGGEAVTEVDWSTRSLWGVRMHAPSESLWLHADANNDEQMNLWRLDMRAPANEREPEQITHADYVYGWGMSEDETKIAYLARSGQQAPYRTCLRLLDPSDPKAKLGDQEVVCDSPALTFTWSTPRFSPDNEQVYFAAQVEGDRKRVQIVEVDLRKERPQAKAITDVKIQRSTPSLLDGWVDDEHLLYTSNEDGYGDVYSWSRRTRKTRRLTEHNQQLLGAVHLRVDGSDGVLVAHGTPAGSTLEMIDAHEGAVLGRAEVPGKVELLDGHEARAVWSQEAPDKVYEANLASFSHPSGRQTGELELRNDPLIRLAPTLEAELVRCEPEAVTIPTFDDRQLHAFVLRPRQPPSESQAVAMVRSFYGGDNSWTRYDHILCAAGITVVSPSVRGSSGFGKAFAALNDRDLGGDEIVDLFWVARFIEAELGVPAARIGVYGRSHGGYATMRAMTFPPETKGRDEAYRFAFGLAEAGFSDIVAFHDATNIPDWVVLEAGDPKVPEDLERLRERSPINHVDRLDAPIFLLHGGNDWRVPVEGSRAFVTAAEALGKPVTYLEVEGQGHHVEGQARIVEAWQARFDFIESALAGASPGS